MTDIFVSALDFLRPALWMIANFIGPAFLLYLGVSFISALLMYARNVVAYDVIPSTEAVRRLTAPTANEQRDAELHDEFRDLLMERAHGQRVSDWYAGGGWGAAHDAVIDGDMDDVPAFNDWSDDLIDSLDD